MLHIIRLSAIQLLSSRVTGANGGRVSATGGWLPEHVVGAEFSYDVL